VISSLPVNGREIIGIEDFNDTFQPNTPYIGLRQTLLMVKKRKLNSRLFLMVFNSIGAIIVPESEPQNLCCGGTKRTTI